MCSGRSSDELDADIQQANALLIQLKMGRNGTVYREVLAATSSMLQSWVENYHENATAGDSCIYENCHELLTDLLRHAKQGL
jgi:hypothetical protein